MYMGVDSFQSAVILDSLMDWVDPDIDTRVNGADEEAYLVEPNLRWGLTCQKRSPG